MSRRSGVTLWVKNLCTAKGNPNLRLVSLWLRTPGVLSKFEIGTAKGNPCLVGRQGTPVARMPAKGWSPFG